MDGESAIALVGQMADGLADQDAGQAGLGVALVEPLLAPGQGQLPVVKAADGQGHVGFRGIRRLDVTVEEIRCLPALGCVVLDGDAAAAETDYADRQGLAAYWSR